MSKLNRLRVAFLLFFCVGALCERAAWAGIWQKTAAGTYNWTDVANWDAVPNATGSTANFQIDQAGDETVNLNQAITLGTLTTGDTNGSSALTLATGSGTNTLTFQSAAAGGATTISVNTPSLATTGSNLSITAGVKLGGTSPLTLNINGTTGAAASVTFSSLNMNGNTLTVNSIPIPAPLVAPGTKFDPGTVTGSGLIVQNGGTVNINHTFTGYTGAITVNGGLLNINFAYTVNTISQITLAGVFQRSDKYPIGGTMNIGSTGAVPFSGAMPDRFNHNGILAFNGGGFLIYNGAILSGANVGNAVLEQVRQIQFNVGMSELRILNGNNTSSSTTLYANDPTQAFTRQRGATIMVGGDDSASGGGTFWLAMGVKEHLVFNGGMASQLIGGTGGVGTTNRKIIPWMIDGTVYHPGQGGFVTYDPVNGVQSLSPSEYFTGAVTSAADTDNVFGDQLTLGTNVSKTINSWRTATWADTEIGSGSVLTITSGAIQFCSTVSPGGGSIGAGSTSTAGTINFGTAEAVIWAGFNVLVHGDGSTNNAIIGSKIIGSGGLTKTGSNVLQLTGANTYTGKTIVNSGLLQVGNGTLTTSKLGKGDVEVTPGSTLAIAAKVADGIDNTSNVYLDNNGTLYFGTMDLATGINETIGSLILGGAVQALGTYGSSLSAATFKQNNYFSGTGILTVTVAPEPSAVGLLSAGAVLVCIRRGRRPLSN